MCLPLQTPFPISTGVCLYYIVIQSYTDPRNHLIYFFNVDYFQEANLSNVPCIWSCPLLNSERITLKFNHQYDRCRLEVLLWKDFWTILSLNVAIKCLPVHPLSPRQVSGVSLPFRWQNVFINDLHSMHMVGGIYPTHKKYSSALIFAIFAIWVC